MAEQAANPETGAGAGHTVGDAARRLSEQFAAVQARQESEDSQPTEELPEVPDRELVEAEEHELSAEEVDETEESQDEETGEPGAEDDGAQAEWGSLDELLQAGGADPANLPVTVKIDGETQEVALTELISGYQREADYRRKTMAFAEEQRQLQSEWTERVAGLAKAEEQAQAVSQVIEQLATNAETNVQAQYQHVNWAELRATDPAEYSAQWADYQQGLAQAGQLRGHLQQQVAQAMGQVNEAREQLMKDHQQRNSKRLLELMPAWGDHERAKVDGEAMVKYVSQVFPETTPDELQNMDARVMVVLHKARLYDELIEQRDEVKAKGKARLLKPGQPGASPRSPKQLGALKKGREFNAAKQKSKQTGKLNDAAAALAARWS